MKARSFFSSIAIGLICLTSCRSKQECPPFNRYEFIHDQVDSSFAKKASVYLDTLLKRFEETPIKGLNYKAYHLHYYPSFGYKESVKFEINHYGCFLTVKCIETVHSTGNCENYKTKITEEEWNLLEAMIYEFDFWTTEPFRNNENVADGNLYILEGNRPYPSSCDPETYKLVARGSARYDKMEALCYNILEYKEQLIFKYLQFPPNLPDQ